MSTWYTMLKRMYDEGKATKTTLKAAVKRGWITEDEYKDITGEKYKT